MDLLFHWIWPLSTNPISADIVLIVLSVEKTGFVPQSEIQWNNKSIADDLHRFTSLHATVAQQTFDSFAGSAGKSVLLSAMSPGTNSVVDCLNGGDSSTVILELD